MLAHLLVSKYCDHLPLYAREGLEIERSTLCDWAGQATWLLASVVTAIRTHVFAADKIHGDDTTVPVLAPGLGRTKTGRLWVYVRDDRPLCGTAPPAAAYYYSPDRGTEHPVARMVGFTGMLVMGGSRNSTVPRALSLARLPKLPAGRTRAAASLTNGSIINRRPPNRR
jgi:hypothetical protein